MRHIISILACWLVFVAACSQQLESLEPEPVMMLPAPVVTVVKSVTVPCPPVPRPSVAPVKLDPPPGAPAYVLGAGTLRLSVAHSRDEAKEQKRKLEKLLKGSDWVFQVWGTRSGKDKRVKARVHAVDVDPGAGKALCVWLETKGWEPGVVPCEMK